jgi:hypothetical protein
VLLLRPNPTPYDVFVPPDYTTPRQVDGAIAALEASRTRWIIRPEGFSGGERWDRYLVEYFELEAPGRYELWKRRSFEEEIKRKPQISQTARMSREGLRRKAQGLSTDFTESIDYFFDAGRWKR